MLEEILEEVKYLSLNNKKTRNQICMKLAEEVGEVNQATLSYLKASGSTYKNQDVEDVKEECVDVIMIAISLYCIGKKNCEAINDFLLNDKYVYDLRDSTIEDTCIKLSVESGKINGEIIEGKSENLLYYSCIAVILTAKALFLKVGGNLNDFEEILQTKTNKWKTVI